jgi:hypothetical protein
MDPFRDIVTLRQTIESVKPKAIKVKAKSTVEGKKEAKN